MWATRPSACEQTISNRDGQNCVIGKAALRREQREVNGLRWTKLMHRTNDVACDSSQHECYVDTGRIAQLVPTQDANNLEGWTSRVLFGTFFIES